MDNKYIHSPYGAPKEAERIVGQQVRNSPLMIVVIEPAVGYLIPALRAKYPSAKIVLIHFHAQLRALCRWRGDHSWYWESPTPLRQFLNDCVYQLPSPRIAVVVPPYVNRIAHTQLQEFHRTISLVVNAMRSDIATVGYFGKRWIKNSLANFLFQDRGVDACKEGIHTVCIVGSGPTLNDNIDLLAEIQHRVLIFALPSALPCLYAHDIEADMVINTDGGHWVTTHFSASSSRKPLRIAMPLTATRELYKYRPLILFFNQGFCIEDALHSLLPVPTPRVRSHGTVAASACELAITLGAQRILFCGVDGAYIESALHCHPHSFEAYYRRHASLLNPGDTEQLTRLLAAPSLTEHKGIRLSRSHAMYAEELRTLVQGTRIPIHRMATAHTMTAIPSLPVTEIRRALPSKAIDKEKAFVERNMCMGVPQRRALISTLLNTYHSRVEEARYTDTHDNALTTLMQALAPQDFHLFWKVPKSEAWGRLRMRCINELQQLRRRYG